MRSSTKPAEARLWRRVRGAPILPPRRSRGRGEYASRTTSAVQTQASHSSSPRRTLGISWIFRSALFNSTHWNRTSAYGVPAYRLAQRTARAEPKKAGAGKGDAANFGKLAVLPCGCIIQTTSAAADSFIGLRGQVTTLFSVGPAAIAGRGSAFLWEADEQTDGQLLAKFVRYRDTEALEVRRHTPMVWGVCRRSADAQGWSGSFAWRCPRNQQGTEPPQAG